MKLFIVVGCTLVGLLLLGLLLLVVDMTDSVSKED
jgi:hypothetical protein